MIENFIEKDIVRQVKLTEYLYELKTLSVKDVAKRLNVTFNTVKRDFAKINIILEDYIDYHETSSTTIEVSFYTAISRYDLIKELYKESRFLRVCSWYLMGDTSYLTIVEEEFVSVAKAFKIKKAVEAYFRDANIMDADGNIIDNELAYRFVMLSIWMRCDMLDQVIDKQLFKRAGIFVDQVLHRLANNYEINKREYQFLVFSAYLSLVRKDKSVLNYSENEFSYLKGSIIFNQIRDIASLVLSDSTISDQEVAYFVSIYRSIDLNTDSYLIVNMNYRKRRDIFIESRPDTVKKLIKLLEDNFDVSLSNNILFEKPFMNFLSTMWYNIQTYNVERHYYLSDSQLELFYKLKEILTQWIDELDSYYEIRFNDTALEKLCSEIESSLVKKRKDKFAIIIVAEDELSHVIYRENITRWLNMDYHVIDNTMYYSVEDVPIYAEEWPHIIVCERALVTRNEEQSLNLFAISKSTLFEDIKNIFLYIYNWQ
ncbi:hypothetical protein C6P52_12455 [Enterococcus mundtii]|nr:hypothetical protein C6P52_12455 [Enterococcus mundtii]